MQRGTKRPQTDLVSDTEEMPDNKPKKRGRPPGGRRIQSSSVNRDQAASSSQSTPFLICGYLTTIMK
jgi:hypothetical protein